MLYFFNKNVVDADDIYKNDNQNNNEKNNNEKKITAYTEEELRYGKYLLDNKSEVLYEYLNKETRKNLSS